MKGNNLYYGLILFVVAFAFCSCKSQAEKQEGIIEHQQEIAPGVNSPEELPQQKVYMQVVPTDYTAVPEKIKLKITNDTGSEIQYGAYYVIDCYKDNNWVEMPFSDEIAFIDIMYLLPAHESNEYDINLFPNLTKYEKGMYRVRKTLFIDNERVEMTAGFSIN